MRKKGEKVELGGGLVDNSNNKAKSLHKLMEFNRAFHAYDSLEGANCQTAFYVGVTQKEAAVEPDIPVGAHLFDLLMAGIEIMWK